MGEKGLKGNRVKLVTHIDVTCHIALVLSIYDVIEVLLIIVSGFRCSGLCGWGSGWGGGHVCRYRGACSRWNPCWSTAWFSKRLQHYHTENLQEYANVQNQVWEMLMGNANGHTQESQFNRILPPTHWYPPTPSPILQAHKLLLLLLLTVTTDEDDIAGCGHYGGRLSGQWEAEGTAIG